MHLRYSNEFKPNQKEKKKAKKTKNSKVPIFFSRKNKKSQIFEKKNSKFFINFFFKEMFFNLSDYV